MRRLLASLTLLAIAACDNAAEDVTLPELAYGGFVVGVTIDRDGSGSATPPDTIYPGARVALFAAGGTDTLRKVTSDETGVAVFDSLPIGRYRYAVIPSSLGDSLPVIDGGSGDFRIIASRDSIVAAATVRVGFAVLTLAEARVAAPGRRVFVRGVVTSAFQFHSDSATYLTGSTNLRVTHASHRPGRNGNNPGDSVSVFGTTGVDAGQPVLLNGIVQTLAERPAPVATDVSVVEARTAKDGELDAALVRIVDATVGDTSTVNGFFHARIAQGADTVLAVIDSTLAVPTTLFAPGREIELRGVLVPNGNGTWHIKPRPVTNELKFD